MKLECNYCGNSENDKFAATKSGAICLKCYEKSVSQIPENEAEKAQLGTVNYPRRATGSSNRNWTKAYREMINRAKFLEMLPDKTDSQNNFIKGFKEAIKVFEEAVK